MPGQTKQFTENDQIDARGLGISTVEAPEETMQRFEVTSSSRLREENDSLKGQMSTLSRRCQILLVFAALGWVLYLLQLYQVHTGAR